MLKYMSTNSIKPKDINKFFSLEGSHNRTCVARQNVLKHPANTKIMSTNSQHPPGGQIVLLSN